MALAAEQAGAVAVRIEGIDNLRVTLARFGTYYRHYQTRSGRLSGACLFDDVDALAQAGAAIIAVDGTPLGNGR